MKDNKTIIILHESTKQSLMRDAGTFAMTIALMGSGWLLGSAAMQWLGFIMICIDIISRASRMNNGMAPQEAADMLCAKFGVRAQ